MHDADIGQRLLADLRKRLTTPDLRYRQEPEAILTGAENWIYAVELEGGPDAFQGPLILRRYRPDRQHHGIRFEAAVQGALAEQGYPAPKVAFVCDDPAPLGGAYLLMQRIPGRVLLGEITRLDEVFGGVGSTSRAAPRMVYEAAFRVPRLVADWMLRLHALDSKPIIAAIGGAGFAVRDFTVDGRLDEYEARAEAADLDGLIPAFGWLRANYQPPAMRVVCHADFHFLNMLVDETRVTGVVDWSFMHLCFEDPAFDVGNTRALFDLKIPGLPAVVRPAFELVQRRLREGFTAHYRRGRKVDPQRVLWSETFRYVREMVGAGEALRRGESSERDFLTENTNPWIIPEVMAGTLAGIEKRTGVAVSLPDRPDSR